MNKDCEATKVKDFSWIFPKNYTFWVVFELEISTANLHCHLLCYFHNTAHPCGNAAKLENFTISNWILHYEPKIWVFGIFKWHVLNQVKNQVILLSDFYWFFLKNIYGNSTFVHFSPVFSFYWNLFPHFFTWTWIYCDLKTEAKNYIRISWKHDKWVGWKEKLLKTFSILVCFSTERIQNWSRLNIATTKVRIKEIFKEMYLIDYHQ